MVMVELKTEVKVGESTEQEEDAYSDQGYALLAE